MVTVTLALMFVCRGGLERREGPDDPAPVEEILVAVTHGEYWKRMESQFAGAGARSHFYVGARPPRRARAIGDRLGLLGHPLRKGGPCLKRLLDGDAAVEQFHEVEEQVIALRLRFDDQIACHRL